MIPLLLLGIGGLALLAFAKPGTAKAKEEKTTEKWIKEAKSAAKESTTQDKWIKEAKQQAEKEKQKQIDLRKNAQIFLKYVNSGGKQNKKIRKYQHRIGAVITGLPDSQSEKRIEAILGYDVSWLPKEKVVAPKVYTPEKKPVSVTPAKKKTVAVTKPVSPVKVSKPKPKPKKAPTPVKKAVPETKPQPEKPKLLLPKETETRAPRFTSIPLAVPDSVVAATSLDGYLRNGGLDRKRVKEYQRRMGSLAMDGIPGPKTKARAETLLNRSVSWPAQNAAEDLKDYYRNGGRNRTKIKAFQNAMGELTVDGLVGPATKKRYATLTGKTF